MPCALLYHETYDVADGLHFQDSSGWASGYNELPLRWYLYRRKGTKKCTCHCKWEPWLLQQSQLPIMTLQRSLRSASVI